MSGADYAEALYPFSPETRVEIPLRKGDIVLVVSRHKSGWWKGKVMDSKRGSPTGVLGYFPAGYVVDYFPVGPVGSFSRSKASSGALRSGYERAAEPAHMPLRASPRPQAAKHMMVAKSTTAALRKDSQGKNLLTVLGDRAAGPQGDAIDGKRQKSAHVKSNSTSTMMTVDSTLTKPDKKASIWGVSDMILRHVQRGSRVKSAFDEDQGCTTFASRRFTAQPKPDQEPTVESVAEFITTVFKEAQLEIDCIIITALYIERLTQGRQLVLTRVNIRPVIFVAMLLASKVWDDMSMWNVDFAGIFRRLTLKKINSWEGTFLNCIKFNVVVKASEYTKMYFNLRAYHRKARILMAPLKKNRAQELEAMTVSALKKIKEKVDSTKKRRSMTMDCDSTPSAHAVLS